MASIEQDIRSFVVENFLFGDAQSLPAPGESFLASGLIDSTGVLELVSFLERHYGITVEDEELIPDNLDSIDRLVGFVERKRAAER